MIDRFQVGLWLTVFFFPMPCNGENANGAMCPPALATTQSLKQVPAGWETLDVRESSALSSAGFFAGHPREMAELAPSARKQSKNVLANTWNFSSRQGAIWLKCNYQDTAMSLSKQLADDVTTCTIRYDTRFSPPVVAGMTCK